MPAPQYVKQQADEARKLMTRPATPAPEEQEPVIETPKRRSDYVDPEDWETRYKHLRAHRDSKFGELEGRLQTTQSENESLQRRIAELQPPPEPAGFRMSDEDREMLGETGSDVVEKVAKYVDSRFEKSESERQAELQAAKQKKTEAFLEELTSLVPNWKQHSNDPKFDTWLKERDERTKTIRDDLFQQGINDLNTTPVAQLFNQYLDERDGSQPNPLRDASPDPDIRSTESTTETFEEWWTAQEVSDHYTEKSRLSRQGKTTGPAWDALMERQARIEDALNAKPQRIQR